MPRHDEGSVLSAAAGAPQVPIEILAPPGGLAIIAPHPDDETLGCGMALAAAARVGREITLVLVTDGEGSHPNSHAYSGERLALLRRAELEQALAVLAPRATIEVQRLGLPDGRSRAEMLDGERFEAVVTKLRMKSVAAIWTSWAGDPHCDHETASAIARALADRLDAALWAFAVWGRFGTRAVPADMVRFDEPGVRGLKRAAMAAHASQTTTLIDDDPDGFVMPPALVAHFAEHPEVFIRER